MSRRKRRPRDNRGRHKRAGSPETRRYLAWYALPLQPSWLSRRTYLELVELRRVLDDDDEHGAA